MDEALGFLLFAFFAFLLLFSVKSWEKQERAKLSALKEERARLSAYLNETFLGRSKAYLLCLSKFYGSETLELDGEVFNATEELKALNLTYLKIKCRVFNRTVVVP